MAVENRVLDLRQEAGLYGRYFKGMLDLVFAVVMLLILAPLMLLIALIITLDSPGPAIYSQVRVGRFGKKFMMYKFRTMTVGAPVLSTEEMQRMLIIPYTRVGRILRKTSLDELPQLFNIIAGKMSFIGPRPALPSQEDVNTLREQLNAHRISPGITGLAQAIGRDDLDNQTKVHYDADYAQNMSFWLDLRILAMTAGAVLCGRGNK